MSVENFLSSNLHRISSEKTFSTCAEKDICNICFNDISDKNYCITSCKHKFCLSCILISIKYKNTCPCCREELITNDYTSQNTYGRTEGIRNNIGLYDFEYDNDLLINDNFYISIRNDILLFRIRLIFFGILIGLGFGSGLQLGYFLTKCTLFLFLYINNIFI